MDPNDVWDMKIHAAQATPDIISSLGTASDINTLDINAAVMFNDEDQLLDEAVELMAFYALPMPLMEVMVGKCQRDASHPTYGRI